MIDLRKILSSDLRGKLMYGLSFLPDKLYLQIFYFACEGKFINFKNPKTFCDKMNWLKIYDRHPEYCKLADKLAVREYIKDVLGEQYLFPIYGKWKSFDEIDFDSLPEQFVLKCNHDSGSVKIIKEKSKLTKKDYDGLRKFYNRRLSHDFFYAGREYPYKGIDRYVFAEEYMCKNGTKDITDYKFFCFNGEPKIVDTIIDRYTNAREDYYDMNWNKLDIVQNKSSSNYAIKKPTCFEEMKEVASKLSKGIKYARIDLYEINGRVYFGEYTFYDAGGFRSLKPKECDLKIASWIDTNVE